MAESHTKKVLIVSKPLVPPWNDGSKNLARGIAAHARETQFRVLTTPGCPFPAPRVISEPIYRSAGTFAPSLTQNARVLLRLLRPDRETDIYHFFFAPNPRTSTIARWITRFKKQATIQTICSPPPTYENLPQLIFTDYVVVLSDYHLKIFREAGIKNAVKINPGIEIPEETSLPHNRLKAELGLTDEQVILYPGDYEYSGGHGVILEIVPRVIKEFPRTRFVFACRPKTEVSRKIEAGIREFLREKNLESSVVFLPRVRDMKELFDLTSLCLFPARSLQKKMDLPLTLLECLAWKIPLVIADFPPLNELMKGKAGLAVRPDSPEEVLKAVRALLGDEHARKACGENGRRLAQSDFDIRKIASQYEALYCRDWKSTAEG